MDTVSRAAFIMSQAACASIEAAAMAAENKMREHRGESVAYDEKAFSDLIGKYGIHHNAVIDYLR